MAPLAPGGAGGVPTIRPFLPSRRLRAPLVLVLLVLTGSPAPAVASEPSGAEPADFLVGLRRGGAALPSAGDAFAGGVVEGVVPSLDLLRVRAPDAAAFEAAARLLPGVRYVERDAERPMLAASEPQPVTPDDPRFAEQYALQQIRAPEAWAVTRGGDDVRVCLLHTGLRQTHQEFAPGRVHAQRDFVNGDDDASDDNGHGTLLASVTAAGIDDGLGVAGVAQVPLLVAKVLGPSGSGTLGDLAEGIAWCADQGGPRTVLSMSIQVQGWFSQAIADAVEHAAARGALVVGTAGLSGPCDACVVFPANLPGVLAVGCTQPGEVACPGTSMGPEVEVVEPAKALLGAWHSADDAYATLADGTFSVAHTTGAAALLWSHAPNLSAEEVRRHLVESAQDLGAQGRDATHGCGEVDLAGLFGGARAPCGPLVTCESGGPANDCFAASRTFTPGGFWTAQSTSGATLETHEPRPCATSGGASVWFTFEAEADGEAWISTSGSAINTALAVHRGSAPSSLVLVDCDDNPWRADASFTFPCVAGETYHVQVLGVDGAAGPIELWQSGCAPPRLGAPVAVRASAGYERGSIELRWEPPLQTGESPVARYRVYVGSDCDDLAFATSVRASWGVHWYAQSGIPGGQSRCYRVSAVDAAGVEGPPSAVAVAVAEDVPGAPRDVVAQPREPQGVRLDWTPPANDGGTPLWGYSLYVSSGREWDYLTTLEPDVTSYEDARLTPFALKFRVVAFNRHGEGAPSADACVRPGPWPGGALQLCDLYALQERLP